MGNVRPSPVLPLHQGPFPHRGQLPAIAAPARSAGMKLGVIMLGLYIVSGYATDLLLLSAGAKPYLSAIAGVCAMIAFLISGHSLRALETKQGKLWCFLTIWLIAGIPFSHWPGGSYHVLAAYIPKIHLILFFICALAITVEDCTILVLANAAGCFALLFECWRYGTADDSGRC